MAIAHLRDCTRSHLVFASSFSRPPFHLWPPPPSHQDAIRDEGNGFYRSKDYTRSVEAYSRAIEATPSTRSAHQALTNRAQALYVLEDFAASLADAEAAISSKRDHAKAYLAKYKALKALGRGAHAIEALDAGIDVVRAADSAMLVDAKRADVAAPAPFVPPALVSGVHLFMFACFVAYLLPLEGFSLLAWNALIVASIVSRGAALLVKTGPPSTSEDVSGEG